MQTLIGLLLVLSAVGLGWKAIPVQAENFSPPPSPQPEILQPIKTESRFSEKLSENTEIIPKKTIYKDDPQTEAGIDTVLEEGVDGKKTQIIKITYYLDTSDGGEVEQGKEYSREIIGTEIVESKDKIISRGTKIIWKTLETADGEIKYWKKMRVWATHYDSHCLGCDETTAIGLKAGKGVIAVDPTVIKLRSKVYIPGYGMAIAGDTGGAIKGNIIDLGFDDARTAGWKARFIDIYLL